MLQIIVGGRQTGKTHRLVEEALKHNGVIVCATAPAAAHAREIAFKQLREAGVSESDEKWRRAKDIALVVGDQTRHRISMCHSVYVDDLQDLLARVLSFHVKAIAVNGLAVTPWGDRFASWEEPLEEDPQ